MRGDQAIIDVLNDVLTAELTAINQYFIHRQDVSRTGATRSWPSPQVARNRSRR